MFPADANFSNSVASIRGKNRTTCLPFVQLQSVNAFCASVTRKSPAVRVRSFCLLRRCSSDPGTRKRAARAAQMGSLFRPLPGCLQTTRRFNCIAADGRSSETAKTEKEVDPLSLYRVPDLFLSALC